MDVFSDRVAVVTGGASGIGRAVSEALAKRGAEVTVADVNGAAAEDVARNIRTRGGRAQARAVDVRDADAVQKLAADAAAARGRIDYFFNNAGIAVMGEERDVSLDDWRRTIEIDLMGVVHGVRAVYPMMVKQGAGHIVNTASVAGLIPAPLEASYGAAKFGVVGLSYALRAEGAALGVKVSVVCPGFIDTPILQNSPIRASIERERLLAMIPWRMTPEGCARVILDGVAKNRGTIVVTRHARALWWLHRLSPDLSTHVAARVVARFRSLARRG
jgi:NAD(P)-dependent dehydrogenase (short-subunit alcohol dehydrogenase family)